MLVVVQENATSPCHAAPKSTFFSPLTCVEESQKESASIFSFNACLLGSQGPNSYSTASLPTDETSPAHGVTKYILFRYLRSTATNRKGLKTIKPTMRSMRLNIVTLRVASLLNMTYTPLNFIGFEPVIRLFPFTATGRASSSSLADHFTSCITMHYTRPNYLAFYYQHDTHVQGSILCILDR